MITCEKQVAYYVVRSKSYQGLLLRAVLYYGQSIRVVQQRAIFKSYQKQCMILVGPI